MSVHFRPSTPEAAARRRRELAAQSAAALVFVHLSQTEQLDDVTVKEHADLFAAWDENWTGKRGTILMFEGSLYRALHDIGAGQNKKPTEDKKGSLWQKIGDPGEEWPMWVPFLGVGDAYRMGDKVTHNGKRWIVTQVGGDGIFNIWEPGVFGWEVVE